MIVIIVNEESVEERKGMTKNSVLEREEAISIDSLQFRQTAIIF